MIELEGLAVRVSEAIAKRDYLEGRLLEDEGLVGLLNLACNIIKHDPPFKTSAQGQNFLQQVFDFLFSLPDPSKRYLPKCKSILARNAAYDLLVEMCRRAPKNYAIVHTKLLEQHQPSNDYKFNNASGKLIVRIFQSLERTKKEVTRGIIGLTKTVELTVGSWV